MKENNQSSNHLQKLLYRFIYPTCAYFTMSIFGTTALTYAAQFENFAPTFKGQLYFWLFSMIMAVLQNIFYTEQINMFFKVLLHYLGSLISFIVIFIVLAANYDNAVGAMVISIVLSVVYFFCAATVLLIRGVFIKAHRDEQKYKRQFRQ